MTYLNRGTTDDLIDRQGLAHVAGFRETVGIFPVWVQAILGDFSKTCDNPNDLEMYMLSEACGIQTLDVFDWCKCAQCK